MQPFEVVISDDSDTGPAVETQRLADEWECLYRPGPRRGLYANRNHAARSCRGTHVRTMDDDHILPAGHFAQCLVALQDDSRALWTTGEISFIDGKHYATAPTANQLHPSGVGCAVNDPDNNWAVADGSTIYPREIFMRGLGMIETFAYGSSYLEFGALLYRCGWRSRCMPGALVEHHAEPATIARGRNRRMVPGQLFASLGYNLCFRPNWLRAGRYLLSGLARDPWNLRLLAKLPRWMVQVRERWSTARQLASISSLILPVDFRPETAGGDQDDRGCAVNS
jgi:glycosyltransferase involved in cell wall biosynthesis